MPPILQNVDQIETERCLGKERFGPYLQKASGDHSRALRRYVWNLELSGAFFQQLALLEVALRNTCHSTLAASQPSGRGVPWYLDQQRLQKGALKQVGVARDRIHAEGKEESPGRVIAGLSFGFWRGLVDAKNEQLWIDALHRSFPGGNGLRKQVAAPLARLHPFRNRLAHPEPVHHYSSTALHGRLDDLDVVASAIGPDFASFLAGARTGLPRLIDRPPA